MSLLKQFKKLKLIYISAKPGLSLVEVMLALVMLGISATALVGLQGMLTRGVSRSHALISRLVLIKNLFVTAEVEKWYEADFAQREQKIEDPPTTLIYKTESGSERAELKKFPFIVIERGTAQWSGLLGRTQQETLVALRFVPKGKKV